MSYVVFYKRLCAFSLSLKNETDVTARALCEPRRRLVVVVSFAAGIMLHFFLSFSLSLSLFLCFLKEREDDSLNTLTRVSFFILGELPAALSAVEV